MGRAALAGCLYFALVFLFGFVLVIVRVLLVAQRLGQLTAVLAELPLILAASWAACGFLVARLRVPPDPAARGLMGALAFGLLIIAELLLSLAFGGTPAGFAAGLATAPGLLGLAGQVAFALMPLGRR